MRITSVYLAAFLLLLPTAAGCGGKSFTCYQYCKGESGQFVEAGQVSITAANLEEANKDCVETYECTAGTTGNDDRFCSCSEEQSGAARVPGAPE